MTTDTPKTIAIDINADTYVLPPRPPFNSTYSIEQQLGFHRDPQRVYVGREDVAALIAALGGKQLSADAETMLAKLDAYVDAFDGDDEDATFNQVVGAAAALRYALTGEIDATLDNLIGNVNEATESTEVG